MKKRNRIFALLTALALLLGLLAGCGGNTAAVMKLRKTKGKVSVSDDAGKSLEVERNLGLYSGYGVKTKSESYAWIDLDEVKLTKLDEDSSVEITKNGGELELKLKFGGLFFNITEPLEDDESLSIRTSSMVIGIRGTCGWVTENSVALLEGKVSVKAGEQSATVNAGEIAVVTADGTLEVLPLSDGDIPAYVREEVGEDLAPEPDEPSPNEPEPDEPDDPAPPEGPGDETPPEEPAGPSDERITGNTTWDLDLANGVLTISGTGDMEDYNNEILPPWDKETIQSVVIAPGVTSIGAYAFYNCPNLTSVDIPNGVTSIGMDAFLSCTSLTSVTIPNTVTSIEFGAFAFCTALTSVDIPNGVISIGNSAFSNCERLTSVDIPNSVTSIGKSAFDSCRGLTSVNIPNSVTFIDEYAFSGCSGLTNVTIPDSVTSIANWTFSYCTKLESVTIPNSVTAIGSSAFINCSKLTDIYFDGDSGQFSAIRIGKDNSYFQKAAVHYPPF